MGLNKLDTNVFDDASNQISIKVLSSHHELHAVWKEKDKIIMKVHYCKNQNIIKLLEGSLGLSISSTCMTEEQKIMKCSEALEKGITTLMTKKSLDNIKRHKELINRNAQLIGLNQKLISKNK
jgi:hypothetical protein